MKDQAFSQILRVDAAQSGDASASSSPARENNARPSRTLPEDAMIILPVRNLVLFPGVVLPITIGREKSRAAAQEAARLQRPIGVLLQVKPEIDDPRPEDMHWVGTAANVLRYVTGPDGAHHVVAQGEERFRVLEFLDGYDFPVARVLRIPNVESTDTEIEARALTLKQRAVQILQLLPQVPEEMVAALQKLEGASQLADLVAGLMDARPEEKQVLLETFDLRERL
ncbi:MAG: LON peptidase substrate-binding domain-containing protein, partial [Burkholderiales bacterium]